MSSLLDPPLHVVNLGLYGFAQDLRAADVSVTRVDWRPPPVEIEASVADLIAVDAISREPNLAALQAMLRTSPVAVGVAIPVCDGIVKPGVPGSA